MAHPGPNIRLFRKQLGLSIRALADATGIERGNLSRIENQKAGTSNESLAVIAGVLHVSVGTLLADHELVEGAALRMRQVPVLTAEQLADWTGPESLDYEEDQRFLHTDLARTSRFCFALTVDGPANLPQLEPGDEIIFDANRQPEAGGFVAIQSVVGVVTVGRYMTLRAAVDKDPGEFVVAPLDRLYPEVRGSQAGSGRLRGTLVEIRKYLPK